jgi:hypothetical protein
MNRRNFLSLPLIAAPDHAARPNIVMGPEGAPAGDPGWADIGCQGAQSDRFHAYPVWPPTRSGLMTGRSPVRLGVMYSVIRPWSGHGVPATEHFPPQSASGISDTRT